MEFTGCITPNMPFFNLHERKRVQKTQEYTGEVPHVLRDGRGSQSRYKPSLTTYFDRKKKKTAH